MIRKLRVRGPSAVLLMFLLCLTTALSADDDAIVVSRGEYTLTLADLDGRMKRFPTHERAQFAHDPSNLARLMDQLLINRILAAEGREMGLDRDEDVRRDLEIAVEEVLAIHRINRYHEPDQMPDFRQLARERYLADPGAFAAPEQLIVEHVLISTASRGEDDARALAVKIQGMLLAGDSEFTELVAEYSDDPGKSKNQGRYTITERERFDPNFLAAADALTEANPISDPVQTQFGFHIIRLVERLPSAVPSFEEVEADLIEQARRNYRSDLRMDKISEARARYPESGNEELLRTLPHRYGGRPELRSEGAAVSEN